MRVHLIRHAHAADRQPGGRDLYRPLTERGQLRATELVDLFAGVTISAVLSSPASRCLQTVAPLATAHQVEVDEQPDLWEGSSPAHVLAILAGRTTDPRSGDGVAGDMIVCSHGDVIPTVIEALAAAGATVRGRGCAKGSIWVLERLDDQWVRASYVPPGQAELPPPAG